MVDVKMLYTCEYQSVYYVCIYCIKRPLKIKLKLLFSLSTKKKKNIVKGRQDHNHVLLVEMKKKEAMT